MSEKARLPAIELAAEEKTLCVGPNWLDGANDKHQDHGKHHSVLLAYRKSGFVRAFDTNMYEQQCHGLKEIKEELVTKLRRYAAGKRRA